MYHEYDIVWFNVVVHARILSDSLRCRDTARPFISISSFSPPEASRREAAIETSSRCIALESRLLEAANVVTCFTARKGITTPGRRTRALPLLLTAATLFVTAFARNHDRNMTQRAKCETVKKKNASVQSPSSEINARNTRLGFLASAKNSSPNAELKFYYRLYMYTLEPDV